MLAMLHGWFRRSVFKTIRFLKHPRKLRDRPIMRWFARHFLDKRVWRPTQHTLSGGMAVGMFITLQLLPIQMPTATILAAIFRVNIPIAIIMCWVSNPVTMAVLVPLEYKVGKWALALMTKVPSTPFPTKFPNDMAEMWLALREHAPVMLFGGVLMGAVLAPLSYVLSYAVWGAIDRWNKYRKQPALPLEKASRD